MSRMRACIIACFVLGISYPAFISAASINFDSQDWETGDINEAIPADSGGSNPNSHIDDFYYSERIPMRMATLDDSLGQGSAGRKYDSAFLSLVVAGQGLVGADSMRIFGRRLTRDWSENGVSWIYYWASADSSWTAAGGDYNNLDCTDTVIIDATISVLDTLLFRLDTGFVRSMIESVNFGWLLIAENLVDRGTFQVYTEDIATESYRPTLTVYFTEEIPPEPFICRRRELNQIRR